MFKTNHLSPCEMKWAKISCIILPLFVPLKLAPYTHIHTQHTIFFAFLFTRYFKGTSIHVYMYRYIYFFFLFSSLDVMCKRTRVAAIESQGSEKEKDRKENTIINLKPNGNLFSNRFLWTFAARVVVHRSNDDDYNSVFGQFAKLSKSLKRNIRWNMSNTITKRTNPCQNINVKQSSSWRRKKKKK